MKELVAGFLIAYATQVFLLLVLIFILRAEIIVIRDYRGWRSVAFGPWPFFSDRVGIRIKIVFGNTWRISLTGYTFNITIPRSTRADDHGRK